MRLKVTVIKTPSYSTDRPQTCIGDGQTEKGKNMRKKKLIRKMDAEVRGQPGPPES